MSNSNVQQTSKDRSYKYIKYTKRPIFHRYKKYVSPALFTFFRFLPRIFLLSLLFLQFVNSLQQIAIQLHDSIEFFFLLIKNRNALRQSRIPLVQQSPHYTSPIPAIPHNPPLSPRFLPSLSPLWPKFPAFSPSPPHTIPATNPPALLPPSPLPPFPRLRVPTSYIPVSPTNSPRKTAYNASHEFSSSPRFFSPRFSSHSRRLLVCVCRSACRTVVCMRCSCLSGFGAASAPSITANNSAISDWMSARYGASQLCSK